MVNILLRAQTLLIALFGNIWIVLAQTPMTRYVSESNVFVDHGFKSLTATSVYRCSSACVSNKPCSSFSYEHGLGNCQLNDRNPYYNGAATKTSSAGWTSYYAQCRKNWHFYDGSCYRAVGPSRNWQDSESNCQLLRGHLVDIQDNNELTFVRSLAPKNGIYWIGLNDLNEEGTYIWSSGAQNNYGGWATLNIRQSDHDCVDLAIKSGVFMTSSCSDRYHAICKVDN